MIETKSLTWIVLALQSEDKKQEFETYNYNPACVIFFYQEETRIGLKC